MTRVLFRKDMRGDFKGSITAVFIDEIFTHSRPNSRTCYAHLGQHSECSVEWVKQDTCPAKEVEYKALLAELISIGYNDLKILNSLRGVK